MHISASQFAVLLFLTIIATAILNVPSITAKTAGQSAWMVPALASGFGLFSLWLTVKLNRRFPEKNLIHYSRAVAGKYIGKMIGIGYILFFFVFSFLIVQQFAEVQYFFFLRNTPPWFLILCFVLVGSYGVLLGVEVIARSAQFVLPLFVISFLSIGFFAFQDVQLKELMPFLEGGISPVIRASVVPGSWFGECIILAFLFPHIHKHEEIFRKGVWAVLVAVVFFTGNILLTMLILGPELTASYDLPFWLMIRFIEVGSTFLRIETVIVFLWISAVMVKFTLIYYLGCVTTAEVFGWKSYQRIVIPFGLILVVASGLILNNTKDLNQFLSSYWPPFAFVFELVIPSLLLTAALILKRGRKNK
ncbi:spore germination protein [Desulfitobacterium hafniense DP7]|uniref:Spore germination protein n=1 Tax=Desulfitobacterium hafniense DP7 TaxID=537010 RepID=G9XRR3_DESHA|nr:endospore germination permease [Desulfitobacterium hafniense]EHL05641.1 spore germination protein [Desulfitobacterium hafniense DP7]